MDEVWSFIRNDCKPDYNGNNFFLEFLPQSLLLCVFQDVMNYVYDSKKRKPIGLIVKL